MRAIIIGILCMNLMVIAQHHPIYFNSATDGNWDIWSINPDGSELKRITQTPYDEKDMALSSDRSTMVYTSSDGYMKIMDLKTLAVVDSFTTHSAMLSTVQPAFYKNGLLFSYLFDLENDISKISQYRNGKIQSKIKKKSSLFYPAPLLESESIAFAYLLCTNACKEFLTEIWVYDHTQNKQRQLTMLGSNIIDLEALSNKDILFSTNKGKSRDIYVVNMESNSVTPLITTQADDLCPKRSMEGENIAFISRARGKTDIKIFNRATKTITTVPLQQPSRIIDIAW